MDTGLQGRVAIVTGAAQGIGEAIAVALAREGASIAVADLDAANGDRVAQAIVADGGRACAIVVDVTRSVSVAGMVREVESRLGGIAVLVNAAGGFGRFSPIESIDEDEWDRVVALNLKSVFLCSRAVVPSMVAQRRGRIINIASQAALAPNPHAPSFLPYGAAKAGVLGFTRLLARDLGPHGITVNAVSPGTTATERVKRVRDAASLERIASLNPMRMLVEPEDTAKTVVFLASEAAGRITGANLNVNAGAVM